MPKSLRSKKDDKLLREKLSATEQYVQDKLDTTDWEQLLKEHSYCKQCPSRKGPEIMFDSGMVNDYCMSCPLKQWLLVTCELALRMRQRRKQQAAEQEQEQNQGNESSTEA